jgi:hypothetical protein
VQAFSKAANFDVNVYNTGLLRTLDLFSMTKVKVSPDSVFSLMEGRSARRS